MSRDQKNHGRDDNQSGFSITDIPVWVHITVAVVIVAVIAFSAYKLWRWNQGTAETEGVVEGDFEVEVLDQIFLMPPDKLALKEDDGQETILFLGNDILTYYNDENGFVEQVQKKLGANCINAGFPTSTVAMKNPVYSAEYPMDAFSFFHVANSLVNGDFADMETASTAFGDSRYDDHTEVLKNVDMTKIDTLVIFYDAQDYISLNFGLNPNNNSDPMTYSGALYAGITAIQEKYPYIRIVCMSFPMCYAFTREGELVNGDRYDFGNGKLTTYLQFMIDNSGATGVSFIDNYYGTIHEDNSSDWLLDNIHVNAACNEHMAEHFVSKIYPNGLEKSE